MKKKMTLSFDEDIYNALQDLPRKISISEFISWLVRATFQEIKIGRSMTTEELHNWMDSTPEGKDFRARMKEHLGPTFNKFQDSINDMKGKLKMKSGASKK